jgi:hypothetical protein
MINDSDRYSEEVFKNEKGYSFFIDKELTKWANHLEEGNPYIVYLLKEKDKDSTRLLINNKEKKVIGEIPLWESFHQACSRIDIFKTWSKD